MAFQIPESEKSLREKVGTCGLFDVFTNYYNNNLSFGSFSDPYRLLFIVLTTHCCFDNVIFLTIYISMATDEYIISWIINSFVKIFTNFIYTGVLFSQTSWYISVYLNVLLSNARINVRISIAMHCGFKIECA